MQRQHAEGLAALQRQMAEQLRQQSEQWAAMQRQHTEQLAAVQRQQVRCHVARVHEEAWGAGARSGSSCTAGALQLG